VKPEHEFTPQQLALAHTLPTSQIWAKMLLIAALFRASITPLDVKNNAPVTVDRLITKTKANIHENFRTLLTPKTIVYDFSDIHTNLYPKYSEPMLLALELHVQFTMSMMVSTFYFYIRQQDGYPFVDVQSSSHIADFFGDTLAIEEVA